ncbi:MAG: SxtJ family membrane protein [Myxococcales bacterium]|nr:SxtJ family membrane protein [Myxococcales bacterium]
MSKLVEINWSPDARVLRGFGFVALVGFTGLAAMAWYGVLLFSFGLGPVRMPVSCALLAVGLVSGTLSLIAPRGNRFLYVGLSVLTYPVGFVLSHLIMGGLFFGLFVPLGVVLRLSGRDSMRRRRDPHASSYWEASHAPKKPDSYFRQF